MRVLPSDEGFDDLYALITLYHTLKNPDVHADLSGRITSLISPAAIEAIQFWMLEAAIETMMLAMLAGKPAEGMQAVRRLMNARAGSDEYSILFAIWRENR